MKMPSFQLETWKARLNRFWKSTKRATTFLLPGNVSRIHYYEARERYYSLKRLVEHEIGLLPEESSDPVQIRAKKTLAICREILASDEKLLTRRQEHLNRLWRSLTRVNILLINNVWTDKQLAGQLNFCREEAYRLRVEDDSTISNFLQQIAEIIDESGNLGDRAPRVKRAIVAAWERFNSIRTRRIHDQYIMIRTYVFAFVFLLGISVLIISNYQTITRDWARSGEPRFPLNGENGQQQNRDETVFSQPPQNMNATPEAPTNGVQQTTSNESPAIGNDARLVQSWLAITLEPINSVLTKNVLAFIYLGGLAGGFFSVVSRISRRELEPGADAYFIRYILTKPFVGAFGAIVLFILFAGGLTTFNLVPSEMKLDPNGTVFGIAFLLGFSERLAFPDISPT